MISRRGPPARVLLGHWLDASVHRPCWPASREGNRVRLAVFTSKYPARVATFFERDMRALVAAGVEIDVFPIYPLDKTMWRYAQPILSADVLPRDRVHHLGFLRSLGSLGRPSVRRLARFRSEERRVGKECRSRWSAES